MRRRQHEFGGRERRSQTRVRSVNAVFIRRTVVLLAATLLLAACAFAQAEPQDRRAEAERLRDSGDFSAAVKLLKAQLAEYPEDGDAARLLAQTLYWMKDFAASGAAYETALAAHPQDTTLRLQYAQMLAETGQRRRARELLNPLLADAPHRAQAEELLGTLAYWDGDLNTARTRFVEALRANRNQQQAKRQLEEIDSSTAPWFRVSGGGSHDDQPLDAGTLTFEGGWFPAPLTQVSGRIQPMRFSGDNGMRTVGMAEFAVQQYFPQWHMETEVAAGGVTHWLAGGRQSDWTQRTAVGFRLPRHVTIRAKFERSPYFYTVASLDTPVMVNSGSGLARWDDPRGWLAEAGFRHDHFPDANAIRTGYGWLLAPLVHRKVIELQAGYAVNASNADESRFVLNHPVQPFRPTDKRFDFSGSYAPYYTPSHLLTHSATAALTLRPNARATFRIGGSYAVHATDDAPYYFGSVARVPLLAFYERHFSPWNIHSSLEVKIGDGLTLAPTTNIGRTVFYSWVSGGVQMTFRMPRVRTHVD